jgi:hypothetical protein
MSEGCVTDERCGWRGRFRCGPRLGAIAYVFAQAPGEDLDSQLVRHPAGVMDRASP